MEDIFLDVFKAIRERRSIRAFSTKEVTENKLRKILDAVRWAPTAGIIQPWIFDAVTLLTGTFFILKNYKKLEIPSLELIISLKQKWSKKSDLRRLGFANIPHFLPYKTQVLFNKEFLLFLSQRKHRLW